MALLVQKFWGGKSFLNPFSAILRQKKEETKKVPIAIKLGGGRPGGGGVVML